MEINRPEKPRSVNRPTGKVAPEVNKTARPNEAKKGTRAAKTMAAREAAAKRNAEMYTNQGRPAVKKAENKPSRARKTLSKNGAVKKTPNRRTAPTPLEREESRKRINSKVSAHTPTRREAERRAKKLGGSVKNLEVKRHTKSVRQKFYVKKKSRGVGKLLLSRLILFFIIFLLMFGLVAGIFTLSLRAGSSSSGREYTLQIGADIEKDDESRGEKPEPSYFVIPKECSKRCGQLYFPVSALSDLCSLTVTGSAKELRYIPRESENETMTFVVDSDIAYVNGAKIRMIAPSFSHGGKLYIPLDFMLKYTEGLVIDIDEAASKITIFRYLEGYDPESDSNIYSPLTFKLSSTSALEMIPESEADIQE